METAQKEAVAPPAPDLTERELSENEWIIRRPKRAKLTAEESLERMKAFESERMEEFVASVRKSKS